MKKLEIANYQTLKSPLGKLEAYEVSGKLVALFFSGTQNQYIKFWLAKNKLQRIKVMTPVLARAEKQLGEYFLGKRKSFDLPYNLMGTEFQKKAWSQLARIPYGKTLSYAEQAKKMRLPKAVRAVGSANGKNPLCVIFPCHRVVASDGSLGGYSGGLRIKKYLLDHEGVSL